MNRGTFFNENCFVNCYDKNQISWTITTTKKTFRANETETGVCFCQTYNATASWLRGRHLLPDSFSCMLRGRHLLPDSFSCMISLCKWLCFNANILAWLALHIGAHIVMFPALQLPATHDLLPQYDCYFNKDYLVFVSWQITQDLSEPHGNVSRLTQ